MDLSTQKRGVLTPRIKQKSKDLLGYEINQTELRLMPYLVFCLTNSKNIDPSKIKNDEKEILSFWRKKKLIEGGASDLAVDKKFWDAMNEIIFLGYVHLY